MYDTTATVCGAAALLGIEDRSIGDTLGPYHRL